jgi:hypothetical protein
LPYYQSIDMFCSIAPPPEAPSWGRIIAFTLFPVAFCLLAAIGIMMIIYIAVRKKLYATMKYDFSRGIAISSSSQVSLFGIRLLKSAKRAKLHNVKSSIERDEANGLQSTLQTFEGSSITLPQRPRLLTGSEKMLRTVCWQSFFYLAAFLVAYPVWFIGNVMGDSTSYKFWIVVVFLTPLQGFWNFLVYFRPHYVNYCKERAERRKTKDCGVEIIVDAKNDSVATMSVLPTNVTLYVEPDPALCHTNALETSDEHAPNQALFRFGHQHETARTQSDFIGSHGVQKSDGREKLSITPARAFAKVSFDSGLDNNKEDVDCSSTESNERESNANKIDCFSGSKHSTFSQIERMEI